VWSGSSGLWWEPVAGCCEHGDEPSGYLATEFVYKYKYLVSFPQNGDMLLAVSQWFPIFGGNKYHCFERCEI
jgi:hypothetical protein